MAKKKPVISEQDVKSVVRSQAQHFLKQANITSVGVGYKITDGKTTDVLSVQFTVGSKVAPERLESFGFSPLPSHFTLKTGKTIPVDIIERSYEVHYEIVADPEADTLSKAVSDRKIYRSRQDPLMPGISISHVDGTAGTIGAIVYDNKSGKPCVLSNWHVLNGSSGKINDPIVQPGPYDDSSIDNNIMGALLRSHLGVAGDCALASISGREFKEEIFGLLTTPKRVARVNLDDKVVKSGRTTGVTYGVVKRVEVTFKINYSGMGEQLIGGFEIRPNPKKLPNDGEISKGGDSGSLWMIDNGDTASNIAAGLHFAGETDQSPEAEHAIACNIDTVLKKLNISFIEKNEQTLDDEGLWNEVLAKLDQLSNRLDRLEQDMNTDASKECANDPGKSETVMAEQKLKQVERSGKKVWKRIRN
jgi:endonuclease G